MPSPCIRKLPIAADTLQRHDQLRNLRWRSARRKPEFMQSLLPKSRPVSMWRQQHTILGEQSTYAIWISFQPGFFIFAVNLLDLRDVRLGQLVSCSLSPRKYKQKQQGK